MHLPRIPARSELDRLCGPYNWRVIGVSALVYHQGFAYLELAKPRDWEANPQGVLIPLTCIGGHLETGEQLLDCLAREAQEEIGVALRVQGAPKTRLIFSDELRPDSYTDGDAPLPWFYTVAPNRLPDPSRDVGYLVIVTYLTHALQTPTPRDVFGLLAVPQDALQDALPPEPLPWQTLCRQSGATLFLPTALPPTAHLFPALTAHSIRLLTESGISIDPPLIDSPPAG
jgi:8-oxo-dGTP pyrophosphatase MutT (NUDIX family)